MWSNFVCLSDDPGRIDFWGRRVPRVLGIVGSSVMFLGVAICFRGLWFASAESRAPGEIGPVALHSAAMAVLLVVGFAIHRTAEKLRLRHLPAEEAGFMGRGPVEVAGWRASHLEHGSLALAAVLTPVFLYFAFAVFGISRQGPFPLLIPLAILFALMGPVAIWHALSQRRRFREWKRRRPGPS